MLNPLRRRYRPALASALLMTSLALSACKDLPPPLDSMQKFGDRLQSEWDALMAVLTGKKSPLKRDKPADTAAVSDQTRVNAELLHEIYKVVFITEPRDRALFSSYVDSMNQGASLEGVYNGFTHSSDYRVLEETNRGAEQAALVGFADELAALEIQLPTPTVFDASSAGPLASPIDPATAGGGEVDFTKPKPEAAPAISAAKPAGDPAVLRQEYLRLFSTSSIFTLKRVLGDEALKVITAKKGTPEQLASWFGDFATRLAGRKIDFGVPQRNQADVQFHKAWALSAPADRVMWEVLNRLHRVINALSIPKGKEGATTGAPGAPAQINTMPSTTPTPAKG